MPFLNQTTSAYPVTNVFPNPIWEDTRDPTSADFRNFTIGTEWINVTSNRVWFMTGKTATTGTWIQAASSGTGILDITGNSGGAVGPDFSNNINIVGTGSITVVGNPATHTLTVIPSSSIATTFNEDSGSATPSSGILNIVGGVGIATSGAGSTVTISSTSSVPTVFQCNSGSATPSLNTLNVFGAGGTTTSGAGATITITTSGSGITWNEVTVTGPTTMAVNNGYIANSGSLVQLKLPTTAVQGAELFIVGKGTGGWQIQQSAGQTIHFGIIDTTTGATGTLSSSHQRDSITLVCTTANTDFTAIASIGNLTYV